MSAPTPESDRLFQIIDTGPIPYEKLVAEVASAVHPGKAYRMANNRVEHLRRQKGSIAKTDDSADDVKAMRIRYGASNLARRMIDKYIERGRLEVYDDSGVPLVRRGDKPVAVPSFMTRTQPYTRVIVSMLGGEGEFSADDIHRSVGYLVPEDVAVERAVRARELARKKYVPTSNRKVSEKPANREDDIRSGRRSTITGVLNGLAQSGQIEGFTKDGERFYRRGPRWVEPDATSV